MSELINKANTNIERIIAKIDNDFNPDNSDWIPRVGAWCIDAMSQLDVLRTIKKRIKLLVKDRIAYTNCPIEKGNIKVFDSNNCELKEANDKSLCNECISTGDFASETSDSITENITGTTSIVNTNKEQSSNYVIAETINDKYPYRYNINHYNTNSNSIKQHNYVIVDCNKIELNYDTNYIYIETEYIETTCSELFGCELPVIPNNGLLIEAITYYCMYKMLCRGYKHPIFNLNASQYGTNPFYNWNILKEEARRSIINKAIDDNSLNSKLFRSNLFIDTFNPRN